MRSVAEPQVSVIMAVRNGQRWLEEAVRSVKAPVYSGLYVDPLSDAEFARTIRMAIDGGASGVSLFEAGAMSPARWAVFAKAIQG